LKTVLCHGCFDILHIGHFRHLRDARSLGDRLVVSITTAEWVANRKGAGHPAHTDQERLEQLLSLRFVDDVRVCHGETGASSIYFVKPALFVKGTDYSQKGLVPEEVKACAEVGARIVYTRSAKRSVREMVRRFHDLGAD
jgi:rfaE bifunctional protein nucleotidyltransferase chain/domain